MLTKSIILCLLVFCFDAKLARCQCTLNIDPLPEHKPFFTKKIGSNEIKIESGDFISLRYGEEITANCATQFKPIQYYPPASVDSENNNGYYYRRTTTERSISSLNFRTSVDFYCLGNLSVLADEGYNDMAEPTIVSCDAIHLIIYETKRHLPWCSEDTASYILAASNLEPKKILGSLCYNLKNMTLESIRYTTLNFSLTQETYPVEYPIDTLPYLIVESIIEPEDLKHHLEDDFLTIDRRENKFLSTAKYDQHSIGLGQHFSQIFLAYADVLNIKWWSNLYKTNWQRFAESFEERNADRIYDVNLGVSGQLRYPVIQFCEGKDSGGIKFENYKGNIPAYIWAYIRALDDSEEFVFISYNSPFFDFFNATDIIFCEDICSEINWLNKIRTTFRYSTMGISFCCSAKAVRNSSILSGFPKAYEPSQLIVETTTPISNLEHNLLQSKEETETNDK